jgi:hypothetical protein
VHNKYKENNKGMTIKGKIEMYNGKTSSRETVFLLKHEEKSAYSISSVGTPR